MIRYISDKEHYSLVLDKAMKVKQSLWIGTADLKDLYVEEKSGKSPFLSVLDKLIKRKVEVRLLHAKEPGKNFREDFDQYPGLIEGLDRALCPRVHFKIIVMDHKEVYIGSANMTGAGMGMKGEGKRNFEAGILTDEPSLVEAAMNHFDQVWMGKHCKGCKRKEFCGSPIL